jgi:hypothetical protein
VSLPEMAFVCLLCSFWRTILNWDWVILVWNAIDVILRLNDAKITGLPVVLSLLYLNSANIYTYYFFCS